MNYQRIYDQLIQRAISRSKINEYYERHHILPKCLGGNNDRNNIVKLTYREHFLSHWLLCKIHPDNYRLKAAFAKMLGSSNNKIPSGWMYDIVKRQTKDRHYPWLKNRKQWNKGTKGLQVAWNKGIKTGPATDERKAKCSETLKEHWANNPHPRKGNPSWNKGLKGAQVAWNKDKPMPKFKCKYCPIETTMLNLNRWHNENCKSRS